MTVSKTNEQALEATIEKTLTGTCREELDAVIPDFVVEAMVPYCNMTTVPVKGNFGHNQ